jgi:2-polyprenyl-3-methyl-5-hydroxy-6-metoxy-1,4-benzoquinol methylase
VLRTFRRPPLAVRCHLVGRLLTAPFLRLLQYLPAGGRLLDLGAGHGTFGLLAATYRECTVVALAPDLRKVLPAPQVPRIRWLAGASGALAANATGSGRFDAVSILDVLYRIPFADWDAVLDCAFASLRPGGVLLLKEIDPSHRLKAAWNRAQERLADLLGMTLGDAFSYETREEMTARLARLGFARIEAVPLGAGYPHAHILYRAYKPPA